MSKTIWSILLMVAMSSSVARAEPRVQASDREQRTARVKKSVAKLGTGEKARVAVTLDNKKKVAGFVSEARDDSFVVIDPKTGKPTVVAYDDVRQVKGRNLSTGAKIAIGVGVAFAALGVLALIGLQLGD